MILSFSYAKAIKREHYHTSSADMETYVWSSDPDKNYDEESPLLFGEFHESWHELYLHFNLDDRPENWTKARISFKVDWIILSDNINISVILIEDSWNENSLTWNNKPSHAEIIKTTKVSEGQTYYFDVSGYASGSDISVCINSSDVQQRGLGAISQSPELTWTYEEFAWINVTSPNNSSLNLLGGDKYDINWDSEGTIDKVKIELYKNNQFEREIKDSASNNGNFKWTIPMETNLYGSGFSIKILDINDDQVYNYSNTFSITQKIRITKPTSSDKLNGTQQFSIEWICLDTIDNVKIELYEGTTSIDTVTENTEADGYYTWTVPNGTSYNGSDFKIKISDTSNTNIYMFSEEFTITPYITPETDDNNSGDSSNGNPNQFLIFIPYMILALVILVGISIAIILSKKKGY